MNIKIYIIGDGDCSVSTRLKQTLRLGYFCNGARIGQILYQKLKCVGCFAKFMKYMLY